MARVTVEDCILTVPNRFDLVMLAAARAKQIASGNPLTVDRDNDKDAVVALREIADKTVSTDELKEMVVQSFSRVSPADTLDENNSDIKETFEEARHHIAAAPAASEEDDGMELAFEEENLDTDD